MTESTSSKVQSEGSLPAEEMKEGPRVSFRPQNGQQQSHHSHRTVRNDDEGFVDFDDEEWSSPVAKILKLPFDDESWQHAHQLLEPPSPKSRKVADEARSIAARHIIDRLQEEDLLSKIHKVAPRLRSAVELLSKPDADYVYPKFQFVVNELRRKYPDVYNSVVTNIGLQIPRDIKPATILVSLAKSMVEGTFGKLEMNWGKFVALLGLAGALAVDSVKEGYPDGVSEVVETFGIIVEQVLGDWILSEGGGWEGFITLNTHIAKLPPIPRTIIILTAITILLYYLCSLIISIATSMLSNVGVLRDDYEDELYLFFRKWYGIYPKAFCFVNITSSSFYSGISPAPKNLIDTILVHAQF